MIKEDDVRYVIDELANGKEVILTIIGGTLMAASSGETVEDTCEQEVHIPAEEKNDHPYKDGITKSDIKDALKKPFNDKVWKSIVDGSPVFYYISQAENGVWFIVKATSKTPTSRSLSVLASRNSKGSSTTDNLPKINSKMTPTTMRQNIIVNT